MIVSHVIVFSITNDSQNPPTVTAMVLAVAGFEIEDASSAHVNRIAIWLRTWYDIYISE
jgi:hypothetical protein